jgi:hypothetical protein
MVDVADLDRKKQEEEGGRPAPGFYDPMEARRAPAFDDLMWPVQYVAPGHVSDREKNNIS